MMLGDFEVTALFDGSLPIPVDTLLTNTTPARVEKAAAHLPFPGIGHVRAEGQGYAWLPASYLPLP